MDMLKIMQEVGKCIGCTTCATLCPEAFEMKENKAHLVDAEHSEDIEIIDLHDGNMANVKSAAESCPVNCIHLNGEIAYAKAWERK